MGKTGKEQATKQQIRRVVREMKEAARLGSEMAKPKGKVPKPYRENGKGKSGWIGS